MTVPKVWSTFVPVLFLINWPLNISGNQPITLKQISVEHGLPGVSLQCIYQDSKGLMWFGIESFGLCKFDGQNYQIYENSPDDSLSISNNFPTKIVEDKSGNIWVGTLNGLNRFDRNNGTFKRYFHDPDNPNSITDNLIADLLIDNYGNLWIGTSNGLSKYNISRNEFIHMLVNGKSQSDNIYVSEIYEDREFNIWIGTWQKGMFLIHSNANYLHSREWKVKALSQIKTKLELKKNWVNDPSNPNSLVNTEVRQICNAENGKLWIGTSEGLDLFDIEKEKFTHWKFTKKGSAILNKSNFSSIMQDSKGILWAGTASNGLVIIDGWNKSYNYLNADIKQTDGLKSNSVRSIYEDMSGLIWIGTKFQGIQLYDPRQEVFTCIQENSEYFKGLSDKFVLSVIEDSDKIIWIGTKEGGLNRYNPRTSNFIYYQHNANNQKSIKSNRIEHILDDRRGHLWLATVSGLEKFNKNTQTFEHHGNLNILCLEQDDKGRIWIGSISSGIFIFDPITEQITRITSRHKELFQNNSYSITRIYKQSYHCMWIGTRQNGLFRYFPGNDSLVHFQFDPENDNSISGNMIRSIFADKDGILWIGTKSDGLNRFNPATGRFNRIMKADGLPSNTIYSILEDDSDNLWMGTHNGIVKYNLTDGSFTNFNESYGLQGKVFEINAFCEASDGMLYFGGSNGLNKFNPDVTFRKKYHAPIIISSVSVFDHVVAVDVTEFREIKLGLDDKYVSFNYSLLDYSDPISNHYAYMLENFDKDWTYCDNRHFANYTYLPPGNYIFKVKGTNMDNDLSKEEASIRLTIPKPYRNQGWFITLMIVMGISVIISVYLFRVSFIRQNEKRLLKIVKQKTTDLRDAYEILEKQKIEIEKHNVKLIQQRNKISLQNKEMEQHRQNLEKLVRERTKDLEEAKQKAEESDRLKSAFLANMSHEIRTPLNAIVGFTDLIANDEYDKEDLNDINGIIKTNSNALLQLINDIIDISKIEANQIEIHQKEFFINEFLYSLFQTYQSQMINLNFAGNNHVSLKLYLDNLDEDLKILSDPFRIEQVLNNLFNNACKFTKEGTIELGYQIINNKQDIRFFMKDTGIGISKENINVVFDRFRKIEDDKTKIYRGTGLGLSISLNLVKLLQGRMTLESEPGKGSMFYFDLPLVIAGSKIISDGNVPEYKTVFPDWRKKTILLVEDEDSNFKVLKAILKNTGVTIVRAEDGLTAFELFTSGKYRFDLVLMDIKLPGMNGIEATRKIRDFNNSVPVIAQTAYAMHSEEKEIMQAGFNDYLTKPILGSVLLGKLSEYLDRKNKEPKPGF